MNILPASSQARWRQAENQTMALARLMARYRHAGEADKAILLNELVDQARVRQTLLGELVQTDPVGAMRNILPAKVRFGMPDEVQQLLVQKQVLQGELEVFYEDYEDGRHKLRHILKTENGRIELQLAEHAREMQTGMRVRARGWLFAHGGETMGSLVLNDSPDSLQVLADGAATSTTTDGPAVLPNTLGEQRTLVLLVNFQDNPIQPWTLEQAQEMVFGTVNDFYLENSYGQTWLSGDVYGYYTLPIDQTCDYFGMDSYVWQAAEDNGLDPGSYDRLIYVFPRVEVSNCSYTGAGTLGGNPSRAWINGSLILRTVGHELGHNLGLRHARALDCGSEIMGGTCISITYGDAFDIMGKSGITGHFNVFNKELLGWLTPESGELITADGDGIYLLEPYETVPAGLAKGLKVFRGIDSTSGQPLWFYLEYRQALGFDSFLEGKPVTDGALFHLGTESDANTSELLDMTPASIWHDLDDASLVSGSSYTDPEAGVTITTEWADATGASVNISYAAPTCIPSSLALYLSPTESAWAPAGATVTYTATVTNQDSTGCVASDFSVTAEAPAGWSADSGAVNLAPGASATVNLSITSAETAADGFYDILIRARNSSDSNYQSDGVVTYVVDTPAPACVAANPALSLSTVDEEPVEAGTPVTYSATVTNQDSSSCEAAIFDVTAGVPAAWSASSASLALAPGENSTVTITVTSATTAADGLYAIDINAQNLGDSNYSSSAAATYRVTPVCEAADPLLSLSSNTSEEVAAGTTVQYTGTVTNRDSSGCEAAYFRLFADLPAGWSGDSTSVNLAPGADAPVTVSITSPVDAGEGLYQIVIHAENAADPSHSGSTLVSYRIANSAPVAVDDRVDLPAKTAIEIHVLANDSDPDGDPLTIIQVTQGSQGSVQISGDGSLLYTPVKKFKGSDRFSYTVSDGERTAGATVSVTLVKNNK